MPLVSAIMAARDAEKWIAQAIGSIINQDMEAWELWVVDDGSTDSTASVVEKIAAADPRVKLLRQPAAGVSEARNAALDRVQGQWITFVDADDLCDPRLFSTLAGVATASGVEVTVSPVKRFTGEAPRVTRGEVPAAEVLEPTQAVELTLYQRRGMESTLSGTMSQRALWSGLRFRPGTRYEDLDLFYRLYLKAQKIAFLEYPLYYYRMHDANFSSNWSPARADALDVTSRIEAYMATHHPGLLPAARDRALAAAFNVGRALSASGNKDPRLAQRCRNMVAERRWGSLFGSNTRLKNRVGALLGNILLPK